MADLGFSDWLTEKYILFRGDRVGREGSITAYASWLAVPRSLVTQWMKKGGKVPTSQKYISILAEHYGYEVYEILGIPKPTGPLSSLPRYLRRRLLKVQRDIEDELREHGITGEMPEAEEIAMRIMERHGFKYTITIEDSEEEE